MGSREGDVTRRVHGLRNALEMVPKNDVEVAAPCRNEPRPCLRTASCCHVMYTGDTGMVFECTDDLGEVSCFFLVFFSLGEANPALCRSVQKRQRPRGQNMSQNSDIDGWYSPRTYPTFFFRNWRSAAGISGPGPPATPPAVSTLSSHCTGFSV